MSNIVGNYFRLVPLTESRALRRRGTSVSTVSVDGVETGPESGNPREGDMRGNSAVQRIGGLP